MNKEIEKAIGANMRKLREKQGMTQESLAIALQLSGVDMTRSAVAKIEVGQRHIYPDEMIALKTALSVTYEDIYDYKKDQQHS